MDFVSQRPLFSTEPSTKGFDLSSGKIWIYPENYPLREYQFQIVKSALYHNTLVCLPTGLGKTFVAAVVMYNFWRWYPQGKIIFLAPTKPLVAQQINACHDIMGIPGDETIELTGATDQKKRQIAWQEHRVIFATPQVFHKDLEKNIVPSDRVKCVVVDEAHKALGKHSYCESIRLLSEQNPYFRVLALSATPGGKLDAVQEVVRNLHITHMELRDDQSPDIIPYINERKVEIVLVGLGSELERFKDRYIAIMDRHVRVLVENNVLRGFAGNISKGRIFHIQKEWQQKPNRGGNHGKIMKTLTILMTMYHAYELMVRHGLRAFYNFYQNHRDKFWLNDEEDLLSLLEEINYYLGPFPDVRPMPDGTISEIPEDVRFGHNKFQKLKEILLRHFESFEDKAEETRAIVFVEYRDIVNEVYVLLLQSRPLIRPQKFVGQAGQKQKQQKLALENFRSNKVNVLISTSVGEEGLDVGEVDLIVCFDISQQSPIRLVQRMGRTGRKRDGHIVVLVTDGKEHQTLKSTMSRRDSLNNKVLQSSGIINALHEESPRMVPPEFDPECQKMVMTVVPKLAPIKGKGKAKEPKKTRKRADANNKAKNLKLSEPSTSHKPAGSQSSLMQFFKKPAEDRPMEVDEDFAAPTMPEVPSSFVPTNRVTQSSQKSSKNSGAIKLSDIKLLSSDNAAVEFLTLCTMKKSENEQTYVDTSRTNPYLPSYHTNVETYDNFFDFDVPDLQILNCLKDITECVVPTNEDENDDDLMTDPSNGFSGCFEFRGPPENEYPEGDSKFEALLDESSGDSDVSGFQPEVPKNIDFSMNEQVDWGENIDGSDFEGLLDEWSEESRKSVEKNELKGNKPNELPCQSPNVPLNEPGVFEDILNISSDDSDTNCNQPNTNVKSKTPEETAATKNPAETTTDIESRGAFEEIVNLSSDESDTDCDFQSTYVKSKTPEEKATTKNPDEATADNETRGAFEEGLNFSSDESGTHYSPQNTNGGAKTPEEKGATEDSTQIVGESEGAFEDILNTSSDESETDFSLSVEPDVPEASTRTISTKRPNEFPIDIQFQDSLRSSKLSRTPRISVDTEIDESVDLLIDYKSESTSRFSAAESDRRNFKIFADTSERSTSEAPKKCTQTQCSMLSVSQTLREIERIRTRKNINNESKVDDARQGDTDDERSSSPVFPDRPRGSWTSRLSGTSHREPAREFLLSRIADPLDTAAESEEDIFGTDDLVVDSDFEAEITNVERSATRSVNTSDREKPCSTSARNKNQENTEKTLAIDTINRNTREAPEPEIRSSSYERSAGVTKNLRPRSTTSPVVSELNLDDCDWDSGETNNPPTSTIKESAPDTEDLADCDWSVGSAETLVLPVAGKSSSDVVDLTVDDCDWKTGDAKNRNPPPVEESIPETADLDDCDWGSDFEAFNEPAKASTSAKKTENREPPKSIKSSPNSANRMRTKIRKIDTTGWISTEKPKFSHSLGSKLTKNIRESLLTKQTNRKRPPSPPNPDSDSENEFAVGRLETSLTKNFESNFFAKPDPVDKATRPLSLGMSNARRIIRRPLSIRQNDVNKLSVNGLSCFAAPSKYTQQQEARKNTIVGVGRQKSASLDLDTRKNKKKHRGERRTNRVRSEFIDDEAEVSTDANCSSGSSGTDDDLHDFVSYTQHADDSVDMHAHYLQTVRSPLRAGGFHMRRPKSPSPGLEIYSQALPDEPNAYLYDSFCVAEDDEVFEDSETADEISLLEEIEMNLKSKKRKRAKSGDTRGASLKRRVVAPPMDTSSSEDEFEKLRRQIHDESFVLRNRRE